MDAKIAELHDAYCQATGFNLPLRFDRQRVWFEFEKAGFTAEDLRLVVRWIRRQIERGASGYVNGSLRFTTLVIRLDEFEEKLHLARHELRPARPRTELREVRTGDIRRQVELPVDSDPVPLDAAAEKFLMDLQDRKRRRQESTGFPLPTTEPGKPREAPEAARTSL